MYTKGRNYEPVKNCTEVTLWAQVYRIKVKEERYKFRPVIFIIYRVDADRLIVSDWLSSDHSLVIFHALSPKDVHVMRQGCKIISSSITSGWKLKETLIVSNAASQNAQTTIE